MCSSTHNNAPSVCGRGTHIATGCWSHWRHRSGCRYLYMSLPLCGLVVGAENHQTHRIVTMRWASVFVRLLKVVPAEKHRCTVTLDTIESFPTQRFSWNYIITFSPTPRTLLASTSMNYKKYWHVFLFYDFHYFPFSVGRTLIILDAKRKVHVMEYYSGANGNVGALFRWACQIKFIFNNIYIWNM